MNNKALTMTVIFRANSLNYGDGGGSTTLYVTLYPTTFRYNQMQLFIAATI